MALRLKRGTTAERLTYTPLNGELVYDTDQKAIYIGDGSLVGGKLLASGGTIIDDLVLNGYDITGTGNIDITGDLDVDGNIHATGNITADGTITIGNDDADEVEFKAEVVSNIVPDVDNNYDLGTALKRWNTVHANTVDATTINGNTVGYHTGDITGSVFADNSTLLVDATSGRIVGPVFANVTGNTTGTHTGNVIGNVLGDVSGNLTGVVTGTLIGAVALPDGTVLFDTRLSGGPPTFPADIVGDLYGSVYGDNSTRLVDGVNNVINTEGTVTEIVPNTDSAYRIGTREYRFTSGYLESGLNISDRHLRIESNKISSWGGVNHNVEVTTTLSASIPNGSNNNFTISETSGIRNGAKFYLNGTSELEVQSIVGNAVTTTGTFTSSDNLIGQTVRFFNPSSSTPGVTFRDVVPATSKGLNGDKPGMVFANSNYIYFCIAPWDGTSDIWVRTSVILATF